MENYIRITKDLMSYINGTKTFITSSFSKGKLDNKIYILIILTNLIYSYSLL